MLIATLPQLQRMDLVNRIIEHPLIGGIRYNVGAASPFEPKETLERIFSKTQQHGKKFWVDLKGRQLRIAHWSHRLAGTITLNHEIEVDYPARIIFRGDDISEIRFVRGNRVFVDPPPRYAVGEGQSVNVHGENLMVKGYLTEADKVFIKEAVALGIYNFMCSFVECEEDILEVECEIEGNSEVPISPSLVLKIESQRGMKFIEDFRLHQRSGNYQLMAARDDLATNIGENKAAILKACEKIILGDDDAIVASRIFSGLEHGREVSVGDWADLFLMRQFGYSHFMLSDEVCNDNFDAAMKAWEDFVELYPLE